MQPVRSAARPRQTAGERAARAWARHPVVAFFRHRNQLAFYRQFHSLLRAGVALPTAFEQLKTYAPDDRLAKGLEAVGRDVQQGATLAEAMGRHGALFDDANVELIAFAEEAGKLDPVLTSLTSHLEALQKLRWFTVVMSLWPLYLAAAVVFVAPLLDAARTVKSAGEVGAVYVSGLFGNLLLAALVLGLVFSAPMLIAALDLALPWDRLKRRLPIVSIAARDQTASRFVTGLGLALGAGLEVVRALRVAVKATNSPALEASLPKAEAHLRAGNTLADAVGTLEVLDRATLGTLAVAERTGTLSETLERVGSDLQASAIRASRVLLIALVAVVAVMLLAKILLGLVGTVFGPVKKLYDAAGSGNLDGL